MQKFLLLTLLCIPCLASFAQSVGYAHRLFSLEGCAMNYVVSRVDDSYCIVVIAESENLYFPENPTMMIRTFSGELITLEGEKISTSSKTYHFAVGNAIIPATELNTTAMFFVTPEQFKMLNDGVAKVRISMFPIDHEHSFKKDKIGKRLYQFFLRAKEQYESF